MQLQTDSKFIVLTHRISVFKIVQGVLDYFCCQGFGARIIAIHMQPNCPQVALLPNYEVNNIPFNSDSMPRQFYHHVQSIPFNPYLIENVH